VGNVRVGAGSLIFSTLLVEDVRVGAGSTHRFRASGGRRAQWRS
jgi:hypothetical protein